MSNQDDVRLEVLRKAKAGLGESPGALREIEREETRLTPIDGGEALFQGNTYGRPSSIPFSVPFFGDAPDGEKIKAAADSLAAGVGTFNDRRLVEDFSDWSVRSTTDIGKAVQVARNMIGYAGEYAITRGRGGGAARKAASAHRSALKEQIDRVLFTGFQTRREQQKVNGLGRVFGEVGHAVRNAPGQLTRQTILGEATWAAGRLFDADSGGSRIREAAYSNYLRNRFDWSAVNQGASEIRIADDSYGMWSRAIPSAVVENLVEVFSENVGTAIMHMVPAMKLAMMGKWSSATPGFGKSGMSAKTLSILGLNGDDSALGVLQKFGVSGIVPELGEELVGAGLRDAIHEHFPELAEPGNVQYLMDNIGPIALGMSMGMFVMGGPAHIASGMGLVDSAIAHSGFINSAEQEAFRHVAQAAEKEGKSNVLGGFDMFRRLAKVGLSALGSAQLMGSGVFRARFLDSEGIVRRARAEVERKVKSGEISEEDAEAELVIQKNDLWTEFQKLRALDETGGSPALQFLFDNGVLENEQDAAAIIAKMKQNLSDLQAAQDGGSLRAFFDSFRSRKVESLIAEGADEGVTLDLQPTLPGAAFIKATREMEALEALVSSEGIESEGVSEIVARQELSPKLEEGGGASLGLGDEISKEGAAVDRELAEGAREVLDRVNARIKERGGKSNLVFAVRAGKVHAAVSRALRRGFLMVPIKDRSGSSPVLAMWDEGTRSILYNPETIEAAAKEKGVSVDDMYTKVIYKEIIRAHVTSLGKGAAEWLKAVDSWLNRIGAKPPKELERDPMYYDGLSDLEELEDSVANRLADFATIKITSDSKLPSGAKGILRSLGDAVLRVALPRTNSLRSKEANIRKAMDSAGFDHGSMSRNQVFMASMARDHVVSLIQLQVSAEDAVATLGTGEADTADAEPAAQEAPVQAPVQADTQEVDEPAPAQTETAVWGGAAWSQPGAEAAPEAAPEVAPEAEVAPAVERVADRPDVPFSMDFVALNRIAKNISDRIADKIFGKYDSTDDQRPLDDYVIAALAEEVVNAQVAGLIPKVKTPNSMSQEELIAALKDAEAEWVRKSVISMKSELESYAERLRAGELSKEEVEKRVEVAAEKMVADAIAERSMRLAHFHPDAEFSDDVNPEEDGPVTSRADKFTTKRGDVPVLGSLADNRPVTDRSRYIPGLGNVIEPPGGFPTISLWQASIMIAEAGASQLGSPLQIAAREVENSIYADVWKPIGSVLSQVAGPSRSSFVRDNVVFSNEESLSGSVYLDETGSKVTAEARESTAVLRARREELMDQLDSGGARRRDGALLTESEMQHARGESWSGPRELLLERNALRDRREELMTALKDVERRKKLGAEAKRGGLLRSSMRIALRDRREELMAALENVERRKKLGAEAKLRIENYDPLMLGDSGRGVYSKDSKRKRDRAIVKRGYMRSRAEKAAENELKDVNNRIKELESSQEQDDRDRAIVKRGYKRSPAEKAAENELKDVNKRLKEIEVHSRTADESWGAPRDASPEEEARRKALRKADREKEWDQRGMNAPSRVARRKAVAELDEVNKLLKEIEKGGEVHRVSDRPADEQEFLGEAGQDLRAPRRGFVSFSNAKPGDRVLVNDGGLQFTGTLVELDAGGVGVRQDGRPVRGQASPQDASSVPIPVSRHNLYSPDLSMILTGEAGYRNVEGDLIDRDRVESMSMVQVKNALRSLGEKDVGSEQGLRDLLRSKLPEGNLEWRSLGVDSEGEPLFRQRVRAYSDQKDGEVRGRARKKGPIDMDGKEITRERVDQMTRIQVTRELRRLKSDDKGSEADVKSRLKELLPLPEYNDALSGVKPITSTEITDAGWRLAQQYRDSGIDLGAMKRKLGSKPKDGELGAANTNQPIETRSENARVRAKFPAVLTSFLNAGRPVVERIIMLDATSKTAMINEAVVNKIKAKEETARTSEERDALDEAQSLSTNHLIGIAGDLLYLIGKGQLGSQGLVELARKTFDPGRLEVIGQLIEAVREADKVDLQSSRYSGPDVGGFGEGELGGDGDLLNPGVEYSSKRTPTEMAKEEPQNRRVVEANAAHNDSIMQALSRHNPVFLSGGAKDNPYKKFNDWKDEQVSGKGKNWWDVSAFKKLSGDARKLIHDLVIADPAAATSEEQEGRSVDESVREGVRTSLLASVLSSATLGDAYSTPAIPFNADVTLMTEFGFEVDLTPDGVEDQVHSNIINSEGHLLAQAVADGDTNSTLEIMDRMYFPGIIENARKQVKAGNLDVALSLVTNAGSMMMQKEIEKAIGAKKKPRKVTSLEKMRSPEMMEMYRKMKALKKEGSEESLAEEAKLREEYDKAKTAPATDLTADKLVALLDKLQVMWARKGHRAMSISRTGEASTPKTQREERYWNAIKKYDVPFLKEELEQLIDTGRYTGTLTGSPAYLREALFQATIMDFDLGISRISLNAAQKASVAIGAVRRASQEMGEKELSAIDDGGTPGKSQRNRATGASGWALELSRMSGNETSIISKVLARASIMARVKFASDKLDLQVMSLEQETDFGDRSEWVQSMKAGEKGPVEYDNSIPSRDAAGLVRDVEKMNIARVEEELAFWADKGFRAKGLSEARKRKALKKARGTAFDESNQSLREARDERVRALSDAWLRAELVSVREIALPSTVTEHESLRSLGFLKASLLKMGFGWDPGFISKEVSEEKRVLYRRDWSEFHNSLNQKRGSGRGRADVANVLRLLPVESSDDTNALNLVRGTTGQKLREQLMMRKRILSLVQDYVSRGEMLEARNLLRNDHYNTQQVKLVARGGAVAKPPTVPPQTATWRGLLSDSSNAGYDVLISDGVTYILNPMVVRSGVKTNAESSAGAARVLQGLAPNDVSAQKERIMAALSENIEPDEADAETSATFGEMASEAMLALSDVTNEAQHARVVRKNPILSDEDVMREALRGASMSGSLDITIGEIEDLSYSGLMDALERLSLRKMVGFPREEVYVGKDPAQLELERKDNPDFRYDETDESVYRREKAMKRKFGVPASGTKPMDRVGALRYAMATLISDQSKNPWSVTFEKNYKSGPIRFELKRRGLGKKKRLIGFLTMDDKEVHQYFFFRSEEEKSGSPRVDKWTEEENQAYESVKNRLENAYKLQRMRYSSDSDAGPSRVRVYKRIGSTHDEDFVGYGGDAQAAMPKFMAVSLRDRVEGELGDIGLSVPHVWDIDNLPTIGDSESAPTLFLMAFRQWGRDSNLALFDASREAALHTAAVETYVQQVEGLLGDRGRDRVKEIREALGVYIDIKGWTNDQGRARQKRMLRVQEGFSPDDLWEYFAGQKGSLLSSDHRRKFDLSQEISRGGRMQPILDVANSMIEEQAGTTSVALASRLIGGGLSDYMSITWKRPGDEDVIMNSSGSFRTGVGYRARKKMTVSVIEGWSKGWSLKYPDGIESLKKTRSAVYEARHNKALLHVLKLSGIAQKNSSSGSRRGLVNLEAQAFRGYSAEPWVATYLNNATSQMAVKDIKNMPYRTWMHMSTAMKRMLLAFGPFHHHAFRKSFMYTVGNKAAAKAFTDFPSMAASSALSYGNALGKVSRKKLNDVARGTEAFRGGQDLWMNNDPLLRELIAEDMTLQLDSEVRDSLVGGGYNPEEVKDMDDHIDSLGSWLTSKGAPKSMIKRVTTVINGTREFQRDTAIWLFNEFGANLKAQAGVLKYREMLEKNAERLKTDYDGSFRKEIAKSVALLLNADFGGLNYKGLGGKLGKGGPRHAKTMMLSRALLLAPDWTESNLLTVRNMLFKDKRLATNDEIDTMGKNIYRTMWLRVISRAMLLQIVANALIAGLDDKRTFQDLYAEAGFPGMGDEDAPHWAQLRWLMVNLSGLSPNESRKFLSTLGHFGDPIKWTVEILGDHSGSSILTPLVKKGSPMAQLVLNALTGRDWSHRRFTSWDELLGVDYDAGEFKRDSGDNRKGDSKSGRYRWQTSKYSKDIGPLRWPEIPSFMVEQARRGVPIPIRSIFDTAAGSKDYFDMILTVMGYPAARTFPRR